MVCPNALVVPVDVVPEPPNELEPPKADPLGAVEDPKPLFPNAFAPVVVPPPKAFGLVVLLNPLDPKADVGCVGFIVDIGLVDPNPEDPKAEVLVVEDCPKALDVAGLTKPEKPDCGLDVCPKADVVLPPPENAEGVEVVPNADPVGGVGFPKTEEPKVPDDPKAEPVFRVFD